MKGRRHQRHRTWFLRGFIAFCALILLYFLLDRVVMPLYTRQGREFKVPDLVGYTIAEAESIAAANRFVLNIEMEKVASDVPPGTILEQRPHAGAFCKTGRYIRVVPAAPPAELAMPNLIGFSGRDANWRCLSLGLVCPPDNIIYAFSDIVSNGGVISHYPSPGNVVIKGDTVRLTISMGPEPVVFIVPELIGQSLHEARKRIREAGLILGSIAQKVVPSVDAGTVIAQSIRSGTEVSESTRIDLVVSTLERE